MSDNKLLLAIADIVGRNTKALEHRIDRVETSLNNKIDEVDNRLSNKIDAVDGRVHNIMLRLENIIEPRLNSLSA